MKVTELAIPGVLHIEPKSFGDERGFFLESWVQQRYADALRPGGRRQRDQRGDNYNGKKAVHLKHSGQPHADSDVMQFPRGQVVQLRDGPQGR